MVRRTLAALSRARPRSVESGPDVDGRDFDRNGRTLDGGPREGDGSGRVTPDPRTLSRRAFVGSLVGATAIGSSGRAAAASDFSVLTWNLCHGVDYLRLLEADSLAEFGRAIRRLPADARDTWFPQRARAVAAAIDATRPDVVGVQEAALVGGGSARRDGATASGEADRTLDYLEVLVSALDDRGLDYVVAVETATSGVDRGFTADDRSVSGRAFDRAALLVRSGIDVGTTRRGIYGARATVSMAGLGVRVSRGYCLVDVAIDGIEATAATTHLERADPAVRLAQAEELLGLLPTDRPVVLAGDVNSGPGTSRWAYDRLARSFQDAHETLQPGADGFTCCQAADLGNDRSRLSRRVDVVLYRGSLRPVAVERVGEEPTDRVVVERGDGPSEVWPSDHAGVFARFEAG